MADLVFESARLERALSRPPMIRCNGKRALDDGWPTGPFEHPDEWRARLADHKRNVGLVMGRGELTIDADLYKPGGAGSFEALVHDVGLDTDTVRGTSGRGGAHLLYTYSAELYVPSVPLEPRGYPAIEIKADGGYIICAPSIHPTTRVPYAWEEGGWAPGERAVAPASEALLELLGVKPGRSRASGKWTELDDDADPRDAEVVRLLTEFYNGHDPIRLGDGTLALWRPGKDNRESHSVTIGFIAPGVAKFWTDMWPPFTQGQVVDLGQLRAMTGTAPKIEIPTIEFELPKGYRLWRTGDDVRPLPELSSTARYGLVGRYLELLEGQSEAGLGAVGAIVLTQLGTIIGRRAGIVIGPYRHHANLFSLVIGDTSTGGKGSADDAAELLVEAVQPAFFVRHAIGGFGSGEALVDAIRDTDGDEQPKEKRRIVHEREFSAVLRVARRESSILSEIIRQGFDYKPIRHNTKSGGSVVSTGHHLAVVGSITPAELARCSNELDIENGWLNRFLFVHAAIEHVLPFGGEPDHRELEDIARYVKEALWSLDDRALEYRLSAEGVVGELWAPWYRSVRFGSGQGRVQSLTRRQHVQAARLALIFAVLDRAKTLTTAHLEAAMAWCSYSVAGAERYFGQSLGGNPGKLLDAIRGAMPDGLSVREQHAVFSRNLKGDELAALRSELEAGRLIVTYSKPTAGRPVEISVAITPLRTNELSEQRGERDA